MPKKKSNKQLDHYYPVRQESNATRFDSGANRGHYESYFLRANHPTKPLAFWFRYSIFSPKSSATQNKGKTVIGELWGVVFNRENNHMTAVKEEFPIELCNFSASGLDVSISDRGHLQPGFATGRLNNSSNAISWDLTYSGSQSPLKLLPTRLYKGKFPAAKTIVTNPMAIFNGEIKVNDETFVVDNWVGSQNHNWGHRHIDEYAWGQVAGFDNEPDAFLECATARVRVGPFKTPWATTAVLRYDDKEIAITHILDTVRAKAEYKSFNWQFDTKNKLARMQGSIEAPLESFIGFNYYKPDGGSRTCLNSKISACQLVLSEPGKADRIFKTKHRAAFEIFNSDHDHGVLVIT